MFQPVRFYFHLYFYRLFSLVVCFNLLILLVLPVEAASLQLGDNCTERAATACAASPVITKSGTFLIKNDYLGVQVQLDDGRLQQVQVNDLALGQSVANGAVLDDGKGFFRLTLLQPGSGEQIELGAADFRFTEARLLNASEAQQFYSSLPPSERPATINNLRGTLGEELALDGLAEWANGTLRVHVYLALLPGADFVQTKLALDPTTEAQGWVLTNAISARWRVAPTMSVPTRNPTLDSALYYQKRWKLPPNSTPGNWLTSASGAGFYAFSNSPFGREYFQDNTLVVLDQYEHQPLAEGFQGGPVVLGYFRNGGAELGYTRYVDYLTRYVSRMTSQNKRAPVFFNTWIPWTNRIDQNVLLKALDQTRQAGYYDILHVDAGWEGTTPLQIDTQKFPGGLEFIEQKAHEQGLGLGLWINPYSDSYFGYVNYETFHRQKRDWHVVLTEGPLPKLGFNRGAFQVLSPYSDYVEERLVDLVSRYDIRMLYWDGADWNIRDSEVDFLDNAARQRLKVLGMKRLMKITEHLYAIRPDLVIVGWNAWVDPHLLSAFDQEQVTDLFTAQLGVAELSRRTTYYGMSHIMPYNTIWSDWYGLTYNERKDSNNLFLPQSQLEYAQLSMLSKGAKEAGGTIDLNAARPELRTFIKNLFSFRKRFDRYFEVYQRLSDAPDQNRADASGHFVDGKGFMILNNPSNVYQQAKVNLNPYLLGLKPGKTYNLYDWTDLKSARASGTLAFTLDGRPASYTMSLPPKTVRIISLDLNNTSFDAPTTAQKQDEN